MCDERFVTDPETGAEYVAFQGDPESASRVTGLFSLFRDGLCLFGLSAPDPRLKCLFADAMESDWHDAVFRNMRDVYEASGDIVREAICEIVHDVEVFPVADDGAQHIYCDCPGRLEMLFRDSFAGAVPEWKAREIVFMALLRPITRINAVLLRGYTFGDEVEEFAICDAIAFLDGLFLKVDGYCRDIGKAISRVGRYVTETGCAPHEATSDAGVDWRNVGWDGWEAPSGPPSHERGRRARGGSIETQRIPEGR